jgi:xanthine/CO dehydrogenase XdhC/CoxF family maturation factor
MRDGRTRLLHYDTGNDEHKLWGLGLGCDGEIDILVQPISAAEAAGTWARVRELLDGSAPFALATLAEEGPTGGTLAVGASGQLLGTLGDAALDGKVAAAAGAALAVGRSRLETIDGGRRAFIEVLLPPPRLLVCGAGDDARPVVALAATAGFRVAVADHRPAYLTAQRFPDAQRLLQMNPQDAAPELPADGDTYAVVKTHSLRRDADWIRRLLATPVAYIGVLGPRARVGKILAELGAAGDRRVFGPVGLDVGADGPEQVGLSIVAELLAVRAGRAPRHLRDRTEAIHAA